MLSRFIPKPSHLRLVTLISTKSYLNHHAPHYAIFSSLFRPLSSSSSNNGSHGNDNTWKFSRESEGKLDAFFSEDSGTIAGVSDGDSQAGDDDSWLRSKDEEEGDVFKGIEKEETEAAKRDGTGDGDDWLTAEGYKPWNLADEERDDVFDIGEEAHGIGEARAESSSGLEIQKKEENEQLEREKKELTVILKGPDLAFGDLISASGITDEMLDSLIALKDFQGVDGLPPLREIEDERYEKSTRKSTRAEIERQKQEDVAKSRVRQVDEKGRAYGTGRRKCSIARVWIQPGDGNFLVNDKEFDVYFPVLDHRAALLRPFSETKSLGLWDVSCTVKGGGVTGQVGAIQLGISRALQNWEPDLRPPLRSAGFLTRDPRVVERKKPGKAKARKSFQWVKR